MAAAALIFMVMPLPAMSKAFKQHDNSQNNTCTYVHDWFKKTKDKHAAFVTTGGLGFEQAQVTKSHGRCQAGGGPTLAGSIAYAVKLCESIGHKHGDRRHCKVVESR